MDEKHKYLISLHENNPLLGPLGPYIETHGEWINLLAYNPLKGINVQNVSYEQRIMLLEDLQFKFEPTRLSLDVCADLQDMMRSGLRARNPGIVEARKVQNSMLAKLSIAERIDSVPWFNTPASGKLISGVTGLGKTHPITRLISVLPKTFVHEKSAVPGWEKTTQIFCLYTKMPQDGFRGGFLLGILIAIDQLCGTDYATQYRHEKIEILAVRVGQILVSHWVGILVIDDIQVRNFTFSPDRDALLLLFLKLLDFGIPIVLIGNPLAFIDIQNFSQDGRRLTTSEPVDYFPFESLSDKDWGKGMIPSFWRHDLMDEHTPLNDEISHVLDDASAGFPHYLRIIRVGVQKYGLRRGHKCITIPLLKEYISQSKTLLSARALLRGFRDKDCDLLSSIEDVPWQEYRVRWGKTKPEDVLKNIDLQQDTKKRGPKKTTHEAKLNSLQERAARQFAAAMKMRTEQSEKNKRTTKNISPGDVRNGIGDNSDLENMRVFREESERNNSTARH